MQQCADNQKLYCKDKYIYYTVIHLGNLSLFTVQVFHRGIPRNEREEVDTE